MPYLKGLANYIEIKWLQRELIEMIYNGTANDNNLKIYLRILEKWRRNCENAEFIEKHCQLPVEVVRCDTPVGVPGNGDTGGNVCDQDSDEGVVRDMCLPTIYEVWDGETLVFKGRQKEIWKKFNVRTPMSHYVNKGCKLVKTYTVVESKETFEPEKPVKMGNLEYLELHLIKRNLPNTVCSFDPTKYVEDLRKMGVEVKITKYLPEMFYSKVCSPKRGRKKYSWLVEKI